MSPTPDEGTVRTRFRQVSVALILSISVAVVVGTSIWGRRVEKKNVDIKLGAPPLVGKLDWRPTPAIIPALVIAVLVVIFGGRISARLRMGWLIALSAIGGAVFSLTLAASDGTSRILDPVVHRTEYWGNLKLLPSSGRMLSSFATRDWMKYFSVHMKGHPPGFILLIKGLAALGLGNPWVTGALSYIGVAMMVTGVLVTTRLVVGDETARRCAPFLVIAPFSMWMGTSADAFFSGTAAVALAFVAMALKRTGPIGFVWAVLGGLSLGGLLFLTYAGATFLFLPGLVAVAAYQTPWKRRVGLGACAAAGMAVVVLIFRGFGFWWPDGLKNTNHFYWHGTAQFRPWRFFLASNLGALIYAIGPAVVAGIASLRRTRLWTFVGGALLCVSFATASQYSKGEVERIWVLFYPWMVPAVTVLPARRWWLLAQSALVIVLQVWLISKW